MFYLVNLNEVGWQKLDYEQVVDESLNEVRYQKLDQKWVAEDRNSSVWTDMFTMENLVLSTPFSTKS